MAKRSVGLAGVALMDHAPPGPTVTVLLAISLVAPASSSWAVTVRPAGTEAPAVAFFTVPRSVRAPGIWARAARVGARSRQSSRAPRNSGDRGGAPENSGARGGAPENSG